MRQEQLHDIPLDPVQVTLHEPSLFEFIGGLALILGFSTRYVAILFVIEFAVASYVVMDMTGTVFASARLPLLILFVNVFLATSGGGRFSVDRVLVSRLRWFKNS